MNKHLILIRHAHRDTGGGREVNNGLSDKGFKQAKRLTQYLLDYKRWEGPIVLASSPKRRCQDTLKFLSKKLDLPLRVDARLDELEDDEDRKKLDGFLESWKNGTARTIIACSHGDWIPLFLLTKFNLHLPLKKAGFVIVEYEEGIVELDSIVQRVP